MTTMLRPNNAKLTCCLCLLAGFSKALVSGPRILRRSSTTRGTRGRSVSPRAADSMMEMVPQLPPQAIVDAVASSGSQRLTAADVAARGGIDLETARRGMVLLASTLGDKAGLEVSEEGELVFALPRDVKGELAAASRLAAVRAKWTELKPAVFTAGRTAFGVAIFASIAIVYSAIFVLATSSSSSSDDDKRSNRDGGGGSMFGGPSYFFGPSPFDVFYYRPYNAYSEPSDPEMGPLQAVFSVVFGDGDPNFDREQRSLGAVASLARRNDGVLTAEQMAPLLSPPAYDKEQNGVVDESWLLPSLAALGGRPELTEDAEIVYVFDEIQATTSDDVAEVPKLLEEKRLEFSQATGLLSALAAGLGAVNLFGSAYLGLQLASLPAGLQLYGVLGLAQSLYPLLVAYAVTYAAVPLYRTIRLGPQNEAIDRRNSHRRRWLAALNSGDADEKIKAAKRAFSNKKRAIRPGDSLYSSQEDLGESSKKIQAADLGDFDDRLNDSRR